MLLYAATVFLSAFLLFQVQPLIAKIILPWFGGSAAVWSAAMLFFQLVLLGGYAYAHGSTRYLKPKWQMAVHVGLLAVSCAVLPILPSPSWKPMAAGDPTLRILALLVATLGLPYFLLSATSPLLQAWYVRHAGSVMPYRLFALSNFGSMLALVSFPFLVEPQLSSVQQAYSWSGGYIVFALLAGAAAWVSRKDFAGAPTADTASTVSVARPSIGQLLLWVGLAACASTLLVAVTNHLSQNVAPIPLLWVVPLALYLLTFILAFESDRAYRRRIVLPLLVPSLGLMSYLIYANAGNAPLTLVIPMFAFGLFLCCFVCHGELARQKPAPRYLTLFYLMVALGGALGGLFVALIAPRVFSSYLELPVGLVACAVLTAVVVWNVGLPRFGPWPLRVALGLSVVVLAGYLGRQEYRQDVGRRLTVRNFYGVLRVRDDSNRSSRYALRILFHGTIRHGTQLLDPALQDRATSYYGPNSGVGRALRALEARGPLRVGVVGLGAGVLSSYGRAGDVYRFYEINPLVEQIATTAFTFYAHLPADKRILLGDARLVLEEQNSQQFDLLAVDAFSGDSIPVHLLTREALALYFRHLKPEGILALHVTNRYLDLLPVSAANAQFFRKRAMVVQDEGDEASYLNRSTWVLLASDMNWMKNPPFEMAHITELDAPRDFRPWTDDYSNLVQIVKLNPYALPIALTRPLSWDIAPGLSIGPVRLGEGLQAVVAVLGPQTSMTTLRDGSTLSRWFSPPGNVGLGVQSTSVGRVTRVWVVNDRRYAIQKRLRVGGREADVRSLLGEPSRVTVETAEETKTLRYDALGIWVRIQRNSHRRFYNHVFEIGVEPPSSRPGH